MLPSFRHQSPTADEPGCQAEATRWNHRAERRGVTFPPVPFHSPHCHHPALCCGCLFSPRSASLQPYTANYKGNNCGVLLGTKAASVQARGPNTGQ